MNGFNLEMKEWNKGSLPLREQNQT